MDHFAWSPDGQTLAAGNRDGTIRLWETATGKLQSTLSGHENFVSRVAWSPDGTKLASGGSDGTVRIWEMATEKEVHRLGVEGEERREQLKKQEFPGRKGSDNKHGQLGHINGLAFAPDGKSVYSASGDYRSIFQWDVETGKEIRSLTGPQRAFSLALSRDGKTLAVGGAMGSIDLWDTATGKLLHPYAGPQGRPFCVAYAPNGKTIASAGEDGVIYLWDAATWRQRAELHGHTDFVLRLQFSADSKKLASGGHDAVRVWDLATQRERGKFGEHYTSGVGRYVALAPSGKLLAGFGTVWDATTGNVIRRLTNPGDPRQIKCGVGSFSPDGRILPVFTTLGIQLCEPISGKVYREIVTANNSDQTAVFSADGRMLLTAGDSKKLQLFEVATGRERLAFSGHTIYICSAAISSDGRLLASASGSVHDNADNSVRVWDTATGKELSCFTAHRNLVGSVAFAPDGKTLASASEDNTVLIWDVSSLLADPRPSIDLSPEALDALWADLAGAEAGKAYQAICKMSAASQQSTELLRRKLEPIPAADAKRIERLISELDDQQFVVRKTAAQALEELKELGEPALRKALDGSPSIETRRRLEQLLEKLDDIGASGEPIRQVRAIEVLEHAGTPEARQLLQKLAGGAPEARMTREAKAAIDRLARRTAP